MPLLRGLKMRLFDNYVGSNFTSIVRNDFQSQFDLSAFGNTFPATNANVSVPAGFAYQLEDADCIVGLDRSATNTLSAVRGHVYDFSTSKPTSAVIFDSSRAKNGYLIDSDNDDLLFPSEKGEFSISFWINPYSSPSGTYDIVSKKLATTPHVRFLVSLDSVATNPVVRFSAAHSDGTSQESIEAGIVLSRWSLVVAKCSGRRLTLSVHCADGFWETKTESFPVKIGSRIPGDNLYLGVGPDGTSNRLDAGSFYLQQICFWDKEITDSEETELYSLGRGKVRFSDPAVPETFNQSLFDDSKYGNTEFTGDWYVDLDADGNVTKIYPNDVSSPYRPCKNCDSEPCCYPFAMTEPSPDEISLSVSWASAIGGCIPPENSFTLRRLPRQIVQGFVFGRTYESDKIFLPCGGYIRFFLESTPYHWSLYKYRNFLGVETNFSGKKRYAKFAITMGSALIRNSVVGGANKFTSPSPSGVSFDFPYTDSFDDYASDIVNAGWTGFAASTLYEDFPSDGCSLNAVDASCIVADGYRFGVGVDRPELRGGDCGWQMGISEFSGGAAQDSKYNYLVTCGSPATTENTRVTPFNQLFNRPFSALARGMIGAHDDDGKIVDANLSFGEFSAILTPAEFARPEPFSSFNSDNRRNLGPGGCIDCEITTTIDATDDNGPVTTYQTRKVSNKCCPQKTLSGAVSAVLSGASIGSSSEIGLSGALGGQGASTSLISRHSKYADSDLTAPTGDWSLLLGGTLRANGKTQATLQIDDYNQGDAGKAYLLIDSALATKIDPNYQDSLTPSIKRPTKVDPYESSNGKYKIDNGTVSSFGPIDVRPVAGSQSLDISNCNTCHAGCESSTFLAEAQGVAYDSSLSNYSGSTPSTPPSDLSFSDGDQSVYNCDGRRIDKLFQAVQNSAEPIISISGTPFVEISARINGITITEECPNLVAKITYAVTHLISVPRIVRANRCLCLFATSNGVPDYDNRTSYYASHSIGCDYSSINYPINLDDACGSGAGVHDPIDFCQESVTECDFANLPFIYGYTEQREAVFLIADTDTCLRPNHSRDKSVTLSFLEDRKVGFRSGIFPQTIPAGSDDFDDAALRELYNLIENFGENPAIPPCKCNDPSYDPPVFQLSPSTPTTIIFSSASVDLEMQTPDISAIGYPEEYAFTLPQKLLAPYAGEHILTSETGEMNWVSETDTDPYMFAILRRGSWSLEIMATNNDESLCRKLVARYRVSGFPDSRWSRNGDNQMQLVSADWTVGNWPIYLTVSPV